MSRELMHGEGLDVGGGDGQLTVVVLRHPVHWCYRALHNYTASICLEHYRL